MLDVRPNRVHREGSLRHPKGSIGEGFWAPIGGCFGYPNRAQSGPI